MADVTTEDEEVERQEIIKIQERIKTENGSENVESSEPQGVSVKDLFATKSNYFNTLLNKDAPIV